MIENAEREGKLKDGYTVVEATSGNTGIGLAAINVSKDAESVYGNKVSELKQSIEKKQNFFKKSV